MNWHSSCSKEPLTPRQATHDLLVVLPPPLGPLLVVDHHASQLPLMFARLVPHGGEASLGPPTWVGRPGDQTVCKKERVGQNSSQLPMFSAIISQIRSTERGRVDEARDSCATGSSVPLHSCESGTAWSTLKNTQIILG